MRKLKIAAENPQHGWGVETGLNRHIFPVLKEMEKITADLRDFINTEVNSIDFMGDEEKKETFKQSLMSVVYFVQQIRDLCETPVQQKTSYLRILSKSFNQQHYQKIGFYFQAVKKAAGVFIAAKNLINPEVFAKGKELFTSLIEELKSLQNFVLHK
jgi:hypothetical protein